MAPPQGTLWSGSVFLGADTVAGPAYLGLGGGKAGHWALYLLLGAPEMRAAGARRVIHGLELATTFDMPFRSQVPPPRDESKPSFTAKANDGSEGHFEERSTCRSRCGLPPEVIRPIVP